MKHPKQYPNNGPSRTLQSYILRPSPRTQHQLNLYARRRTTRPETSFAIFNMTRPTSFINSVNATDKG